DLGDVYLGRVGGRGLRERRSQVAEAAARDRARERRRARAGELRRPDDAAARAVTDLEGREPPASASRHATRAVRRDARFGRDSGHVALGFEPDAEIARCAFEHVAPEELELAWTRLERGDEG